MLYEAYLSEYSNNVTSTKGHSYINTDSIISIIVIDQDSSLFTAF